MTKQIELKTVKITLGDQGIDFDYAEQLIGIMGNPSPTGQGGCIPSEMHIRLSIIDKLKRAKGAVILDDSEWALLEADLSATKFRFVHEEIVSLNEAVKDAEDVEIKEVKKKSA